MEHIDRFLRSGLNEVRKESVQRIDETTNMVQGDIEKVVNHVKKVEDKMNSEVANLEKNIDLLEKRAEPWSGDSRP
eukprot:9019378-Lingulodinium_polyedra.AAC.1